ncbi:YigZ family protein [Idiomarina sp. UBA4520]|uniref:YigZ family protein n=1 Tax=Idiomarina sp. UBA4520 TaxID=1946647 RepID=UPI000AFA4828|nr:MULTISPECIES: YigZ family protein [unclassified Idiomarina]MBF39028.1 YigZ family protein [Idiomarinaceae bacterium]
MSGENYLIVIEGAEAEIEVKGSRFIACLSPAKTQEEALDFKEAIKRRYPKASHYCTASVFGHPEDSHGYAYSDDGEPSGTAGRPMLMALSDVGIGQVTAVVVRYFGGTKLGTGGLQRAYKDAVLEALPNLASEMLIFKTLFSINFDYTDQGAVEPLLERYDAEVSESEYSNIIKQEVRIEPSKVGELQEKLKAATQGRVQLRPYEPID